MIDGPLGTYDYDSFGDIKADGGIINQPYTFTGREYDSEMGLYFYRARYYDSQVGRFLTRDPVQGRFLNPLTLNRYAYVSNNPINRTDPQGLEGKQVQNLPYSEIRGVSPEERIASLAFWLQIETEKGFGGGFWSLTELREASKIPWAFWQWFYIENRIIDESQWEAREIYAKSGIEGVERRIDEIRAKYDPGYSGYQPPKSLIDRAWESILSKMRGWF